MPKFPGRKCRVFVLGTSMGSDGILEDGGMGGERGKTPSSSRPQTVPSSSSQSDSGQVLAFP